MIFRRGSELRLVDRITERTSFISINATAKGLRGNNSSLPSLDGMAKAEGIPLPRAEPESGCPEWSVDADVPAHPLLS